MIITTFLFSYICINKEWTRSLIQNVLFVEVTLVLDIKQCLNGIFLVIFVVNAMEKNWPSIIFPLIKKLTEHYISTNRLDITKKYCVVLLVRRVLSFMTNILHIYMSLYILDLPTIICSYSSLKNRSLRQNT